MDNKIDFRAKLGLFVIIGLGLFIVTVYLLGRQRNLFGSSFHLKSQFKTVSGLKIGNNVRFSGINIGTVTDIQMTNDTTVLVNISVKKEICEFIKTDAKTSISSDGLMGDKVLIISPGLTGKKVKNNSTLASKNPIEMEDIMKSMKNTLDNANVISNQLAQFTTKMNNENGVISKLMADESFATSLTGTLSNLQASSNDFARFTYKMNNGNGTLNKLLNDDKFGKTLDSTMYNLQKGTKGLSENMEAAKNNVLLKGYFKKKKRAEAKKLLETKKKEEDDLKKLLKKYEKDSLQKIQ
jgi:phospholipid/cholesterol/gamma-HCH transport system substrate-binding protein